MFTHSPLRSRRFCDGLRQVAIVLAGILALAAGLMPVRSLAAVNTMEYQLKAGFLFNFAKFIEWPPTALSPNTALRLGVLAPDEVYAVIEKSLAGKSVGLHPLLVERITVAQLEARTEALPNILFVHQDLARTRQENSLTPAQLLGLIHEHPVLLVGESAGFATSGGMIGFVQRGENLRFQVNLGSAQRAGLKLSARLSGLAEVVTSADL